MQIQRLLLALFRKNLHLRNKLNFGAIILKHNSIGRSVKFNRNYCIVLLLMLIALSYGCANIVPPDGGPADKTPPKLLSITPADSGLNIRPTKIEMHFSKFMVVKELEKNIQLSPILPTTPVVMANGRKVTITIPDSELVDNTTYRIGLGDALTDNRENTPYGNFTYVFSTGSYFDSLELHGKVIDAKTGLVDSGIVMMLYEASENDTAILRKKPRYATRIDATGNFKFQSLPQRSFRIYAVQDANNNMIYDYGDEKVGFLDHLVTPSLSDSSFTFYTFKEIRDTTLQVKAVDTSAAADSIALAQKASADKKAERTKLLYTKTYSKLSKSNMGYKVNVDSSDLNKRTFDIRYPLTIDLLTWVGKLDTPKVYLSYDNNGIEVEAVQHLWVDSGKIKISTQWQGDKEYTLRLVKGWAKDTLGDEFPPGKYKFRTKGEPDYSSLIVHLAKPFLHDSLVLYVFHEKDSVYRQKITDSIVTIKLLDPGNYGMQIIVDANRNGKWDPGILMKQVQPEKIINYATPILLKAGWDNEVDFTEATTSGNQKPLMNGVPPKDAATAPVKDAGKEPPAEVPKK